MNNKNFHNPINTKLVLLRIINKCTNPNWPGYEEKRRWQGKQSGSQIDRQAKKQPKNYNISAAKQIVLNSYIFDNEYILLAWFENLLLRKRREKFLPLERRLTIKILTKHKN